MQYTIRCKSASEVHHDDTVDTTNTFYTFERDVRKKQDASIAYNNMQYA